MKRILFFLILLSAPAAARAPDTLSSPHIPIGLDYACFGDSAATRLEVYYSLSSTELELIPAESLQAFLPSDPGGGKNYALVLAVLELQAKQGGRRDSLSKTTVFRVAQRDTSNQLSELLSLSVPPGSYKARLLVFDLRSGRSAWDSMDVQVEEYKPGELNLSSIQLARVILGPQKGEDLSFHAKADRKVVPNPAAGYTLDDPRLYYYLEIYGLEPARRGLINFEFQYALLSPGGDTLKLSGFRKYPKSKTPSLTASVDLAAFPPGEYALAVAVRDPSTGQTVSKTKTFLLYPAAFRAPVPDEELAYFSEVTHFLLRRDEKEIYKSSNRTGQLNFIAEFWKKHDPTPETPENEFQLEVYGRFWKANDRFSRTTASKDGWNTDRGRVLMLYGEPNNEERFPASASNLPWEKWEYNRIAGGKQALFVFVDLRGLGNYQLVHSTAPGEKQTPAWEDMINQNVLRR